MAVTVTKVESFVIGDRKMVIADVLFDASYAIGGEAVTASNFGFDLEITHIWGAVARDPDAADNAVVLDFDEANSKLIAFWSNNDGVADGPLIEVPDTTALSAYTARVVAVGK